MPETTEGLQEWRDLAARSVERWLPRRCSDDWLGEVSGPARFVWDRDALQIGFHDPLYRCFDARPERWRPALAAALLAATGRDPEEYSALLAALEALYLSTLMLHGFRNGHSLQEAAPRPDADPLSVLATAAYTAAQLAPTLISRHADALPPAGRSWLACRFGRALVQCAAGTAEHLGLWRQQRRFLDDGAYVAHLWHYMTPLTFVLPIDCLLAACGEEAGLPKDTLRRAAAHCGIAYQLRVEWEDRARVQHSPERHPIPLEPSHFFAGPDTAVGHNPDDEAASLPTSADAALRFHGLAQEHRALAERDIQTLPPALRDGFAAFAAALFTSTFTEERRQPDAS